VTVTGILGITPFERPDVELCAALAGTVATPILDLGHELDVAQAALEAAEQRSLVVGVRFADASLSSRIDLPEWAELVVLPAPDRSAARRCAKRRVLVQVTSLEEAHAAQSLGAAGIIAKGSESGGRVGDHTAFVLFQQLIDEIELPIWVQGGIGRHTAAACVAGGAKGVVLDSQLACLRECSISAEAKRAVARMDGSESRVLVETRVCLARRTATEAVRGLMPPPLAERFDEIGLSMGPFLVAGQDIALAGRLGDSFPKVARLVSHLHDSIHAHIGQAKTLAPLGPDSKLAKGLGITYPIVQGPMSRVSDRPAFAEAIAEAGGLPTLALALMDGRRAEALLRETAERLGDKRWGVGILGFAPPELHSEQRRAIEAVRPSLVIIAGGRPNQARAYEELGIPTYLHVPSTGLLELFLQDGARRFIFEGHECGGHVGPRSSFVLWEEQLEALRAFESPEELSVLFAGGIHDARSAAMVSGLAAPLAATGAEIGVIMGTGYLFTREAVSTGAILPAFQEAVRACERTALLETAPGHATRCAQSAYVDTFRKRKAELASAGTPPEELWAALERLNLGRLRIAAKGEHQQDEHEDNFTLVDADGQRREGLFMAGQLSALRSDVCTVNELHREVSVGSTDVLEGLEIGEPVVEQGQMGEVAIIGISCIFPDAPELDSYWANVVAGRSCIREVPTERWNPDIYYDPEAGAEQRGKKSLSKWGGFLPKVDFDPIAHGTPPHSLPAVEPVQLLSLEVATRALKDAGYHERDFDRSRVAVIFGAETGCDLSGAYTFRSLFPMYVGSELPEELDHALPGVTEDTFPGIIVNVIAGRVANRLDLGGVNFTVDAACASSLASVYTSCQELLSGNSDMVLCGGADLHNSINDYLMFSSVQVLSKSGKCRTFGADADGIVLGEGVAVVVLKRLADAERDGDRIYATIKGIAGTSDGRAVGLTVPRKEGQTRVLKNAYARAGVSPRDIGLVEAHGTGTVLGDRNELAALTEVYTAAGVEPGSCGLGSVKSQIGHTKCCAGLAGLIKVVMSLYTRTLPPTCEIRQPNPGYDPQLSPFALNTTARPWPGSGHVAAVSAFGFGGSNFHAVVGEYAEADSANLWPAELLTVRGGTRQEALSTVTSLLEVITHNPQLKLRDVAHSTMRHGKGPVQLALVTASLTELLQQLTALEAGEPATGVFQRTDDGVRGKVAYLFPGQGSQRVGMLADLFTAFPQLEPLLELGADWLDKLFPPTAFDPENRAAQASALKDTTVAQPLMGIADLAIADVLTVAGVKPDLAGGHSYGELVALCAAGAVSRRHLGPLSTARASAILSAAGDRAGTMAAVRASADTLRPLLSELDGGVVIANHNAPDQTVISGPVEDVVAALELLRSKGFDVRDIPVSCAFHSPLIAPAASAFAADLAQVRVKTPRVPVYSNTTATVYPKEPEAIRARMAQHLASPVRFLQQVRAMYDAGARIFVEVGPGRVLTGLVRSILAGSPHLTVACNELGQPALPVLLRALAELAVHGVDMKLEGLFEGRNTTPFPLQDPPSRPAGVWQIDGHRATPLHGELPEFAMHPVTEPIPSLAYAGSGSGAADRREALVAEFLQGMRDMVRTQRDVMLSFLGTPVEHQPLDAAAATAALRASAGEPAAGDEVATAASEAPQLDIKTMLLEQVSDRTGYPVDMLDLDLDLAADLSIDSIKRVEILGVLSRKAGFAKGDVTQREQLIEELAACKTLRRIIEVLERTQAGEQAGSEPSPAEDDAPALPSSNRIPDTVQRFVLEMTPAPVVPGDTSTLAGKTIAVTEDGGGIAQELTVILREHGAEVRVLEVGEAVDHADGFVLLDSLRHDWHNDTLPELFGVLRDALVGGVTTVVVATGLGGQLGAGKPNGRPVQGGMAGLVKTAAKEWPEARIRMVDFDTETAPTRIAEAVLTELAAEDACVEVGYCGDVRQTLAPVGQELMPADLDAVDLGPESVVLLTGRRGSERRGTWSPFVRRWRGRRTENPRWRSTSSRVACSRPGRSRPPSPRYATPDPRSSITAWTCATATPSGGSSTRCTTASVGSTG